MIKILPVSFLMLLSENLKLRVWPIDTSIGQCWSITLPSFQKVPSCHVRSESVLHPLPGKYYSDGIFVSLSHYTLVWFFGGMKFT